MATMTSDDDDGDTGKYAQIGQMNPSAACTIIVRMRSIERIDAMMSSSPPPVAGRGYVVSKQQRQGLCVHGCRINSVNMLLQLI
jgi:hypothetical protein